MRRAVFWQTFPLLILIMAVSTLAGFTQAAAPAPQKAKQTRTTAEYNAYNACYLEKDFARKAELCEKFISDFKDSDYLEDGYKKVIESYIATKNWQKAMDTADRAVTAAPNADNSLKAYAYFNAMIAAQNLNNIDIDKVISYGDKVLAIDPNDFNTLYTLSTVIPQKSPSDKAQLEKAAGMASKALAVLQPLINQATPQQKPAMVQADSRLHQTLGVIAFNEKNYTKSISEYQKAIADNRKDDAAHYYLAFDYIALMVQASQEYQTQLKAENDAKSSKADQPTIDELAAKRQDSQEQVIKFRDMVIDELAVAVAINGPVAGPARTTLTEQWMTKNDSLAGMDDFINQKKMALEK